MVVPPYSKQLLGAASVLSKMEIPLSLSLGLFVLYLIKSSKAAAVTRITHHKMSKEIFFNEEITSGVQSENVCHQTTHVKGKKGGTSPEY